MSSEQQDLCKIPSAVSPNGLYNLEDPVTLEPDLIAASAIMTGVATVFLVGRLRHNFHSFGWSDAFVVLGYLSSLAYTINNLLMLRFARHLWDVPLCLFNADYLKQIYVEETMNQVARFFTKGSILILYLQLFSNIRWLRVAVAIGLVFDFLLYGSMVAVFLYFGVPHGNEAWEDLLTNGMGQHLAPTGVVQGPCTVVLDLYIFVLPLPILWGLQMTLKKRLRIAAVFATGLLGVISSLVTLRYLVILLHAENDSTWSSTITFIWCIVENNVAIAVSSTPAFVAFTRVYIVDSAVFRSLTSLISRGHRGGNSSSGEHSYSLKPMSIITWGRSPKPQRSATSAGNISSIGSKRKLDHTQQWYYELSDTALNMSASASRTRTITEPEAPGITRTTVINQVST
ncbi:uncharacterized protein F4807DRAFT_316667 [Annulohypoxylon truncatum]|uniref:uncharacterized protein n=1 Tax=Annulohypoxylon truncatum TaxID=327061 RepID=UPI0020077B0B|nr:uncharacterized protein F4807DRAFT_316667 [Annulohypoxylon truncatum]KAI1204774.1 hypothetical protein F4807DRAFT_316667 [Annulohypoxylon truncatum]